MAHALRWLGDVKTYFLLFGLVGCGGIAIVDDAGNASSATTTAVASSGTGGLSGTGGSSDYPCTGPRGPGLSFGEVCLQGASAPCPPLSPELDQQLLEQMVDECEASFGQCCPGMAGAHCGPDPNAAGCCYMVGSATPNEGCL